MSGTSSKKKTKEMHDDRLSALPDGILCHILSFLEMRHAAKTCLLSKRWQFLWTQLPSLRFKDVYSNKKKMKDVSKFVTRVNRTLLVCRRDNLERFKVDFLYNYDKCFAFDVNAWVGFAVANKVKTFSLSLSDTDHVLPQMMYSNASWTSLTIKGCIMTPLGTILWHSLTMLQIESVELNENAFEKIFSGCPVLSSLDLVLCSGFDRLEVNSSSLRTLAIDIEVGDYEDDLQISAPFLHTLKIVSGRSGRMLRLENIKSLIKAELLIEWDHTESSEKCIKQLLESIRHVKMLKLGHGCIKHLSIIAPSWQPPQSTRKCLELNIRPSDKSIRGIIAILESSPDLETLIIRRAENCWYNAPLEPDSKDDLDCDLLHLKTVRFKNFDNHDIKEPMITLAQILLERAVALELMAVDYSSFSEPPSIDAFDEITEKLLIFSSFSQRTVILFSKELFSSIDGH